jgi:arylsulfatase A-like enzyme
MDHITRRKALVALALGARGALAQQARPNIVYIMADDLGYADLSCYGRRDYATPNIDRLAAEGMKFLQAYANSAVCTATRTALITGRYQYRLAVGLEEPLTNAPVGLPPEHPTLPSLLRKAGYGTTLIGKWHLGRLPNYGPLKSGYDHFWGFRDGALDYFTHKTGPADSDTGDLWDDDAKIEQTGYLTELLGDRAVKVIGDYAAARQPFFLSLHFNAPHWPWEGREDEAEALRIRNLSHYDGGSLAAYASMVTALDQQVGRVIQALEQRGIAGNTLVIFTSDNGGERFSDTWPFSGKKMELLEGGLRIPAIVKWPGRVRAGSATQQVSMSMDWLPTLVAAAGTTPDPAYPSDGINLLPALTQGAAPVSRKVYWRYNGNSQRALRDGDMKWLKIRENTFLFNVVQDPLERANLKDRQPDVYRRLVQDYENWNAAMLPQRVVGLSGMQAGNVADHIGNERPAAPAKPQP